MAGYDQDIKVNSKFLKIEAGEPHDVRLLNPEPIQFMQHRFAPPKQPAKCGGAVCPYCQDNHEPSQRFATNAYDFHAKKVVVWEYGAQVARQLRDIYKALMEEDRKITEVDLRVSTEGSGINKKWSITPRSGTKTVPGGLTLHDLGDGKILETPDEDTPF